MSPANAARWTVCILFSILITSQAQSETVLDQCIDAGESCCWARYDDIIDLNVCVASCVGWCVAKHGTDHPGGVESPTEDLASPSEPIASDPDEIVAQYSALAEKSYGMTDDDLTRAMESLRMSRAISDKCPCEE